MSVKSLLFCVVASWPVYLEGGVPGCRGGPCPIFVCLWSGFKRLLALVLSGCFTFSPTTGSAPIKWTCTVVLWRRDQDSGLTRPSHKAVAEKKMYWASICVPRPTCDGLGGSRVAVSKAKNFKKIQMVQKSYRLSDCGWVLEHFKSLDSRKLQRVLQDFSVALNAFCGWSCPSWTGTVPGRLTSVTCKMDIAPTREYCMDFYFPILEWWINRTGYMNQRQKRSKLHWNAGFGELLVWGGSERGHS